MIINNSKYHIYINIYIIYYILKKYIYIAIHEIHIYNQIIE